MCKPLLLRIRTALLDLPTPADVQSVLRLTPVGGAFTIVNALVFVLATWNSIGGLSLGAWLGATTLLSLYVIQKSFRARKVQVTAVSRRAANRLNFTSFLLALPWGILAIVALPKDDASVRLLCLVVCAGMFICAVIMLQRTIAAALVYVAAVNVGILIGCAIAWDTELAIVALYDIFCASYVTYGSFISAETARERDRSLERLALTNEELEAANQKISSLAYKDMVSGLPNRKAFIERVSEEVELSKADGRTRAVMVFDLDNFKNINDSFGHQAGDKLLALMGTRMRGVLGDAGLAARLGGDEFAVIAPLGEHHESADSLAGEMIESLSAEALVDGRQIFPGTSIGVALLPQHGTTSSTLLRKSDAALARAKDKGKGGWVVFDHALSERMERMDRIGIELKSALEGDGLVLHYQPKIDFETGLVGGAEALVRWIHPTLGALPPDRFLSVAAEQAMMHQLSAYVFKLVTRDILVWREAGLDTGRVAINVHPLDLKDPDHLIRMTEQLAEDGLGPEDVSLEITEGCFVGRGTDTAAITLDALADKGYRLALDDFGTGHAALSHLRELPVDEIKIDKGFVANVASSSSDRAIVDATVAIARGMGLKSVAEGVETLEQFEILREMGTSFGQGYFWSPPLDPAKYLDFAKRTGVAPRHGALEAKKPNELRAAAGT